MQAPSSPTSRVRKEPKDGVSGFSGEDAGSLGRLDSFDDYFMLHSPPDSPRGGPQQHLFQSPSQQQQYDATYSQYSGVGGHVHDNAKMSTSYITVDRSNSIAGEERRPFPATQRDIEELLKMDEKDFNLSELFLKKDERQSLNKNFEAKGALKGHDKEMHRTRSHSFGSSHLDSEENRDISAPSSKGGYLFANHPTPQSQNQPSASNFNLDIDVDPTPLSEIRRKNEERDRMSDQNMNGYDGEASQQQQRQNHQHNSSGENTDAADHLTSQRLQHHQYRQDRQNRLQHSSNYYPFGRSYQLPIPTMPATAISPSGSSEIAPAHAAPAPMADAVATAAAIASTQDSRGKPQQTQQYPQQQQQQQQRTSPHSPALQPSRSPSRQTSESSHQSRGSHSPHHPNLHNPYPAQHQQHHGHQHHQHAAYPVPHHMPPAAMPSIVPGQPIVGPYTTAQRESSNGVTLTRAGSKGGTSGTKSLTQTTPAPAPPSTYLPRRGDHTSREASAAHANPKGAIDEADKQRRRYSGFHKPATSQTTSNYHHPLPQKFPGYTAAKPGSATYPATTKVPELSKQIDSYVNGSQVTPVTTHQTADSAYERKKQRAKDARVKLNESIERLHIAMSVAGSESKKRATQLREILQECGKSDQSSTDHQAFELMESCVKTAESAKKWDRPNFVGSAATLIQCLNSQCEILIKELAELHEDKSPERAKRPTPASRIDNAETQTDTDHRNEMETQLPNGESYEAQELPGKRRRLNDAYNGEDEKKDSSTLMDEDSSNAEKKGQSDVASMTAFVFPNGTPIRLNVSTMDLIAAFLDPISIVQCLKVCREWRSHQNSFLKDVTWINICVKRFGSFNTRQWQERQSDDDEDEDKDSTDAEGLELYRVMDSEYVMPPHHFEGAAKVFLGKAKLSNNAVTAWTFLIERSNGETQRSVKRNPATESSSGNLGAYASIPVVELRTIIQNTGGRPAGLTGQEGPVIVKEQLLTVDASTRRRGEEMLEINWDERFNKKVLTLDGSVYENMSRSPLVGSSGELARLRLFEAVVLVTYIHARRCSTSSKFVQRSNFTKILLSVNGSTTEPLVIPFSSHPKDANASAPA